ncbi:SRPBCC family protein [Pseudomonas sp. GV071]|uniref:SRPBCC family protein n=1 Tax=Pseudomonas sp. GV071 TaxID=2135754 RepID=UPI000D35DA96|nr:SRPBCC family protein [Pseudomonas sp. GV071]PTQ69123.1 polyketide cyclase/dehydrase/lipid transport protein [Pseudomonas sp. GV071]
MKFDTATFRARYRADIHPRYNAWLHGGFVLLFGALCIGLFWSRTEHVQPWEWLAVPLALVFQNWGEYMVHKHLGHHKHGFSALFYKRHTGDHHSFFAQGQMAFETRQDWRVIFFPPWLIAVFALGTLGVFGLLSLVNSNVAALFSGSMLLGYLSYEILHACEHLPEQHPISGLPWVRQMRRLHELHHARELMHTHNFNIVFPLWDWIYGTLYWEAPESTASRWMQHHVDIRRSPAQVFAYVSCPTRWHEWHPYHIAIDGPPGSLPAGSTFEYQGGRAGALRWQVLDVIAGQRWQARASGKYGLQMVVTYDCSATATGTRFTRTLEYRFGHWIGRLAARLGLHKRIERDSVALLQRLGEMAEKVIAPLV